MEVATSYYEWLQVTVSQATSDYKQLKVTTIDEEPHQAREKWLQVTASDYMIKVKQE